MTSLWPRHPWILSAAGALSFPHRTSDLARRPPHPNRAAAQVELGRLPLLLLRRPPAPFPSTSPSLPCPFSPPHLLCRSGATTEQDAGAPALPSGVQHSYACSFLPIWLPRTAGICPPSPMSYTNAIHHFYHPNRFWHLTVTSILGTKYLNIQTEILALISMQMSRDIDIPLNAMPSLPIQTSKRTLRVYTEHYKDYQWRVWQIFTCRK
jgi:hypothetical protein